MKLRLLLIVFIVSVVTSGLSANEIVSPENFSKDITVVSLNPTWSCGPCRANDNELNSLVNSLQSDYSTEMISLSLTSKELREIFDVTGVPTTLFYRGDQLIEVVQGVHSDSDYAEFVGFSLANYKKLRDLKTQRVIDQFEKSFRLYVEMSLDK